MENIFENTMVLDGDGMYWMVLDGLDGAKKGWL